MVKLLYLLLPVLVRNRDFYNDNCLCRNADGEIPKRFRKAKPNDSNDEYPVFREISSTLNLVSSSRRLASAIRRDTRY